MPEQNEESKASEIDAEKKPIKNNYVQKNEKGPRMEKDERSTRNDRSDRDYNDKYRSGPRHKPFFRRKVCKFCTKKYKMDYKDVSVLRRFTSDRGKILPRRITGTCAKHQRQLSKTVKRARVLALMPFVAK